MKKKGELPAIKRKKDILCKVVDGKGVLLDLNTGAYYTLNDMGIKVWNLCDGKSNVKAIQSRVAVPFGKNAVKVRLDVEKFLKRLKKEKLLK